MSPRQQGSAAAPVGVPESAENKRLRARLRAELPPLLKDAERTLGLATQALRGPDPEASLEYLALLAARLRRIRATFR